MTVFHPLFPKISDFSCPSAIQEFSHTGMVQDVTFALHNAEYYRRITIKSILASTSLVYVPILILEAHRNGTFSCFQQKKQDDIGN